MKSHAETTRVRISTTPIEAVAVGQLELENRQVDQPGRSRDRSVIPSPAAEVLLGDGSPRQRGGNGLQTIGAVGTPDQSFDDRISPAIAVLETPAPSPRW